MVAFVSPLVDVDACLVLGPFSKWFGCSASSSASVEGVFECFEGQLEFGWPKLFEMGLYTVASCASVVAAVTC